MNISAKTEYACIAMLQLAADFGSGQPIRIREIAESNGIPSGFLVQILLQLKSAGLVTSIRGASGGYQLAKDPSSISLGEVMRVMDGLTSDPISSTAGETDFSRILLARWTEVAHVQQRMLNAVSFADLLEQIRSRSENMYYI